MAHVALTEFAGTPVSCYAYPMTITQTVEIPADHRVFFDAPHEIPVGATARCEIHWFPHKKAPPTKLANSLNAALEKIQTLCKDSPITVDSFFEMRRQDKELEEQQFRQFFPEACLPQKDEGGA